MKLDRSKNTARNMAFGVVAKIYNLLLPFVMRTLLRRTLGMAYTGLNSLFTSILSVLSLAELGVGSAMTFSMYKPIAEDDTRDRLRAHAALQDILPRHRAGYPRRRRR